MNVEERALGSTGDDAAAFDDAVLGAGLALDVEQLIVQAGRLRACPDLADRARQATAGVAGG
jgi:hypothetical protein